MCTFIPGKKSIVIDENLYELANSFSDKIIESTDLPDEKYYVCIGSLINTYELIPNNHKYFIKFDFSADITNQELHKIEYENNLDSLIDYQDGFNAPLEIIFGLLECIRKHYNSNIVHIVTDDSDKPSYLYLQKLHSE